MSLVGMPSPLNQVKTAILQNHINISTLGILVYEYIALVRSEVKSIWRRRITAVSILFLWNRYVSLIYGVLGVLDMSPLTPKVTQEVRASSCTVVTRLNEAVTVLLFMVSAIFPAIRIYAIWRQNVPLGTLVFMLLMVPAGANTYLYIIVTPTVLGSPKPVCVMTKYHVHTITKGSSLHRYPFAYASLTDDLLPTETVVIASRTTSIFSEGLVLVLTCIKTLGNVRTARAVGMSMSMSVSEVLVKKGALYFLVFLLLNIAQTVIQETTGIEYLSPYLFAITSTLMTRFLLNLRQVDNPSSYAVSTTSDTGSVVFDRHQTPRTEGSPNNGRNNTDTEARSHEGGPMSSLSRFVEGMGADLEFGDDDADEESRISPRA